MNEKTKNLQNLLKLVKELSSKDDLEWFKNDLKNHYKISETNRLSKIEDIYEYCINDIIEQQAKLFYSNFKIDELKFKLIEDFIGLLNFWEHEKVYKVNLKHFQK